SAALKNSLPADLVRSAALEKTVVLVSGTVPLVVPSLCQTVRPVPSSAVKKSRVLKSSRSAGLDDALPPLMFLTRLVLPAVPSVFHSSRPLVPSSALKYSVAPIAIKRCGDEELSGVNGMPPPVVLMFLSRAAGPAASAGSQLASAARVAIRARLCLQVR